MRNRLLNLVLIGLMVALGLQIYAWRNNHIPPAPEPEAQSAGDSAYPVLLKNEADYPAAFQSSLFSLTPQSAKPNDSDPTALGIVEVPEGRKLFVRFPGQNRAVLLATDESFEGWTLIGFGDDFFEMDGPEGRKRYTAAGHSELNTEKKDQSNDEQ